MAAENGYRLYRKNSTGMYVTVRRALGETEIYPETGLYPRRVSTVLSTHKAARLLAAYTFTGVTLPRNRLLRTGTLLLRPAGGFALCLDYSSRDDTCDCLESVGGRGSMNKTLCGMIYDMLVSGELSLGAGAPENGDTPAPPSCKPELGRFYGVGDCFFAVFSGGSKGMVRLQPQNGWFDRHIDLDADVFGGLLDTGAIKPVEGPLFRIKGNGQLLPILTRYKRFELADTGQVIDIQKVSPYAREVVPACMSYDELITKLCNRSLVPYMNFHF